MTCRSQGQGSTPAAEVSRIGLSLHLGKGKPRLDWAWLPRAGELRPSRGLGGSFGRASLSLSFCACDPQWEQSGGLSRFNGR